jgi:Fe-S cluster biogenesis protein NfuA
MFIQTEATPNPATLKFLPGKEVLIEGTADFRTKDGADWQHMKPAILGAIMEQFMSGAPVMASGGQAATDRADQAGEFYDKADSEIVITIKELLDTRVRPAVAQDGGDITFRGYENGTVFLHMKGACAGCPSSTATLKHGIQNLLRHFVPEVEHVEQIG